VRLAGLHRERVSERVAFESSPDLGPAWPFAFYRQLASRCVSRRTRASKLQRDAPRDVRGRGNNVACVLGNGARAKRRVINRAIRARARGITIGARGGSSG